MTIDFGGQLISALIGAGVGYALKFGYDKSTQIFVKERSVRKVWSFLQEPTHIFIPVIDDVQKIGAVNGFGDLLALSIIVNIADRYFHAGKNLHIHTQYEDAKRIKEDNIIVLGGGNTNPLYREYIDIIPVPLHFFDTATESFEDIRNKERSVVYKPEYDDTGNLKRDIGLVVRTKNPANKSKVVILAAGSFTYGTAAAIQYLTTDYHVKEISRYLDSNFELIVGTAVEKYSFSNIERISRVFTW